jgi:hypothetical protein
VELTEFSYLKVCKQYACSEFYTIQFTDSKVKVPCHVAAELAANLILGKVVVYV